MPTISEIRNSEPLRDQDALEEQDGVPMYDQSRDRTVGIPASRLKHPAQLRDGLEELNIGTNSSASQRATNSSVLQDLADRASGGNKILQLPGGVIEHDEPIQFYDDSSNNFNQYGKFRLQGITDTTNSSRNNGERHGTTLKYTGDPSKIPYQFGENFAAQRYIVRYLNFEATTNEGVPVVRVKNTFQRSDFTDLFVEQNGEGDGMIVNDAWVSGFERIACRRKGSASNAPRTNGIGFQFHHVSFGAGNTRLNRITGSGFRYGVVVGGLTPDGNGQTNTRATHLQAQGCHVGVFIGFGASRGHVEDTFVEGYNKAAIWYANFSSGDLSNIVASSFGGNWNAAVQVGMDQSLPITGTASDTVTDALRDTSTDFGTDDKSVTVGTLVVNTTTGEQAHVTDIQTEWERGNGATDSAVHQLGLTEDIFSSGDSYAVSPDLDNFTATDAQKSNGEYDGSSSPTQLQSTVQNADITVRAAGPYRGVGVRYHTTGRTENITIRRILGATLAGRVSSLSSGRLIDSGGGLSDARIDDKVTNRATGDTANVVEIISDTELDLDADIFSSTNQAYRISGQTLVQNEGGQGLQVLRYSDADGEIPTVASQPTAIRRLEGANDETRTEQHGPYELAGPFFEPDSGASGDTIFADPGLFSLDGVAFKINAAGSDQTTTLPDPDDPQVHNRVIRVTRIDGISSNTATVDTVSGGGDISTAGGNVASVDLPIYGSATFKSKKTEGGNTYFWRLTATNWNVRVENSGTSLLESASKINISRGIKATESSDQVAKVKLAMEVKEGGTAKVDEADQLDFDSGYFDVTQDNNNPFRPIVSFKRGVLLDGGAKEIDVADLSGSDGADGQVPQTDGDAVSWQTLSASDISDVSPDSSSDAHHSRYTDAEARNAVGVDTSARLYWNGSNATLHQDDFGDLVFGSSTGPAQVTIASNNTAFSNADTQVQVTAEQADIVAFIDGNSDIVVQDDGSNAYSSVQFWLKIIDYS